VQALALSRDGKTLATCGQGLLCLWDLKARQLLCSREGAGEFTRGVAFGPRGDRLATVSLDGPPRFWDASGRTTIKETGNLDSHAGSLRCLAFSPDGKSLATAGTDRTVRVWLLDGAK
jgi:WD40 repeat protein